MGSERPDMAERIGEHAGAVAVKLILDRALHRRTGGKRVVELCIDVIEIEKKAHRCTLEGLRAEMSHIRHLVGEHDMRVTHPKLRMAYGPARPGETHHLGRAEGAFVKIDGLARIAYDEIRRDAAVAFRDLPCHCNSTSY